MARWVWLANTLIYGLLAALFLAFGPALPGEIRPVATPLAWLSGGIAFLTGIAYWAIPPGPEEAWLELRLPDRDPVNPSAFVASASRRNLRMGIKRNRLTLAFGLYLLLVPVPSWQGIAFPWSTAIGTIRLFGALVIALALWTLRVLPAAIASGVWDLVLLPGGIFWPSRLRAWLIPWEVIEGVSLTQSHRQAEYGVGVLRIRIKDLSRVTFSPPMRMRMRRRRMTLLIAAALYALRASELEQVLQHYVAHPEDRDSIGTAEGMAQITRLIRSGREIAEPS